jgi:hypothetical protein
MTDKAYKVYLTPLIKEMTYGDEVEISDYVINSSLGSIKKMTDSNDGTIGEYALGSCDLTCSNYNGEFNQDDPRSHFPYKRDGSKIRVTYYDSLTESTLSFRGLVNDEGTTSSEDDTIKIKVIELANILRKEQIGGGTVNIGDTFSDAIKSLLNQPAITAVLTYDENEISVGLDLEIDDEGYFGNISTWDGIKALLIVSNSIIYIDNETVKVKARNYKTGDVAYFYGPGDQLDRENIIKISNYNNGAHRIFNSVTINDYNHTDSTSASWFGLKEKSLTFSFITDTTKESLIAQTLVEQFRYPRIEFEMTVPTSMANDIDFFDTIGVTHPVRTKPYSTNHAALWDVSKYDTTGDTWNVDFGGFTIDGRLAFKIIQRTESPKDFLTTLKMRGRGKTFDDGILVAWAAVWDFSLYDISTW